ncbi:hypothetical protein SASPL_125518 [Salvia splendens]|uniref:Gibberellin regulated protein n=1 Tax=Salvia splendens TaxID=180675 RepID=A0A8X8ZQ78_SALSN|nr:hypothetical protein SASPL_125518 [Salvia splendens]
MASKGVLLVLACFLLINTKVSSDEENRFLKCAPLCVVRCKNHSRKNVCMRACVTCCDRCKCVPPGQYGNREKCGKCYANMTTRGGKLKCP